MTEKEVEELVSEKNYCGEPLETKEGYCTFKPTRDDGRCGFHTEIDNQIGAKKGEARNLSHGVYAKKTVYWNEKLDDHGRAWVEAMVDSFIENAPFGRDDLAKMELLWQTVIDIHKRYEANDYIAEKGITQSRTQFVSEVGSVREDEENVLHITVDRLGRSNMRILKGLGIIGDEDSHAVEVGKTIVDFLSEGISEE